MSYGGLEDPEVKRHKETANLVVSRFRPHLF